MSYDFFALCMGVLGALLLIIPLKEFKNEYFALSLSAISVLVISISLKGAKPLFSYMTSFSMGEYNLYLKTMVKALGISIVANLTSELAEDLGMKSLSGKVEFAGKVAIMLSAMPVFDNLFNLVSDFV
ncbi:MAG: hypothetical protein E7582_05875 [Ruminococcaceae bacterium]|nr:hypothetical protein [Oscillospiraceae bacterium]